MRQISNCRLWIGHVGDMRDLRSVLAAGIVAVVDLALNEPPAVVTRELVYCRFPLLDGSGNSAWVMRTAIDAVSGFLRANVPTLVYCGAGMSRSVCIAAAGIALVRGIPLAEALAVVTQSGPADVSPGLWAEVQAVVSVL